MKNNRIITNLKIVEGGKNLQLKVKIINLKGTQLNIDDTQKVCTLLGSRYRISATPYNNSQILVNSRDSIGHCNISIKKGTLDYKIDLEDIGNLLQLKFQNPKHRNFLADLYKRALLIELSKSSDYWTFDSPRIFYEKNEFKKGGSDRQGKEKDISAFRRYEISELILDEGIAISVDVGTAFFTNKTVNDYFQQNATKKFDRLTNRQQEQRGTLLYKSPNTSDPYRKCYFVKYDHELTCGTTGSINYAGKEYDNLYDYYKSRNSKYKVLESDQIAYVNFPGMKKEAPVAANKLWIRVMNDMLPHHLSNVDKISPPERSKLFDKFWLKLGNNPFGHKYGGLNFRGSNFMPPFHKSGVLNIPELVFANNHILSSPKTKTPRDYKNHFRDRKKYLMQYGVFSKPYTMTREINFVYPENVREEIAEKFANDVCELVEDLTGIAVEPVIDSYSDYRDMINFLNDQGASMVTFIFDKLEPAAYYTISHELKNTDIKRVTSHELTKKYNSKYWNSFIELNTFDILQQLNCLPWICNSLNYDIHLAIDVSEKFSHFCFSFHMLSEGQSKPIIKTDVFAKTDKKEKINGTILKNKLNNLFDAWSTELIQNPPKNMLIIRDGKVCDGEFEAIQEVINDQINKNHFLTEFDFDLVEYHKTSRKGIRMWDRNIIPANVMEGTYFKMDKNNAVLSPTGEATLYQGTSHPILIKKLKGKAEIETILQDIFSLSQLNFSSPTVAQSLCLPIKKADELLKERKMQEVERIK